MADLEPLYDAWWRRIDDPVGPHVVRRAGHGSGEDDDKNDFDMWANRQVSSVRLPISRDARLMSATARWVTGNG
jgi:hypothetical protein